MKTILTALREEGKATDEEARTIARALGGATIAAAILEDADSDDSGDTTTTTYTVTFDLNTGTGTAPDSVTGAAGTSVTLPDGTGITPPANKTFAGWGETSDAATALESYTISKDATLYAVYTGQAE